MCLAKIYLKSDSQDELLLENVAAIEISGQKLTLSTILMETKEIEAKIKKIDFTNSRVILEQVR